MRGHLLSARAVRYPARHEPGMQVMRGFPVRQVNAESVNEAAAAVAAAAKRQAEQLTLVRRQAQPTAVYITRLTLTATFAYLLAQQLPGGSPRSVLAPLSALLVAQATLYHTIRSAIQRVVGVTAGVVAAVAVSEYVPFTWWVRSEEHTSELQSHVNLVCRLLL